MKNTQKNTIIDSVAILYFIISFFHKSDINFTADRISLMKSERIAGKLTYTEIFSHPLI